MTGSPQKATDVALTEAYADDKSVWRVAQRFGMSGQSVHERLTRLGVRLKGAKYTADEIALIESDYQRYRDANTLDELAALMGRPKTSICSMASTLGLTDTRYPRTKCKVWANMGEDEARRLFEAFKKTSLGVERFCAKRKLGQQGFSETMRRYFADEWDSVLELKAPKQSYYRLGRQFEYRVRDLLRDKGYFVMRSPASKSPVDLVAIKRGCVLLVQCKRSSSLSPNEWNTLYDLALSIGAEPIVASMPGQRGTEFHVLCGQKTPNERRPPWEVYHA